MKSCPACHRTFDDTMVFCLEDGSILSAPFDPEATRQIPFANQSPNQTLHVPPAFADEMPTVVRSGGVTISKEIKRPSLSIRNVAIGLSIFLLFAAAYTQSVIPLAVGVVIGLSAIWRR